MPESFVVQRETQIAAPRASVFAFLTDPEKIVQWMGSEAVTEMHPGGLYLLKGVAYSFGWEGNDEVPPGSGLIEIDLIEHDGGTLLRMTHSGLPSAAHQASHAKGWIHYIGRLTKVAAGQDPGPDRGPNGTRNA
jgi:uncharacterized protein YndB with AHSA1/START domain